MKRNLSIGLFFVLLLVGLPSSSPARTNGSGVAALPSVAVLSFTGSDEELGALIAWVRKVPDVFVTELRATGKFRVLSSSQVQTILRREQLNAIGPLDKPTAVRIGKLLGVNYLLTGAVTQYGIDSSGKHIAKVSAQLIDTSTGEIVWEDAKVHSVEKGQPPIGSDLRNAGVQKRMFDQVMKPVIRSLTASLKAADL